MSSGPAIERHHSTSIYAFLIRQIHNPRVVLVAAAAVTACLLASPLAMLIYSASYAYHALNLYAYTLRRIAWRQYMIMSLAARSIALLVLAVLMWPYLGEPINSIALIPLLLGTALHALSVRALGLQRTYYAVELGVLPPLRIRKFPYNSLPHPMEIGAILQFVGLYLLIPAFTHDYRWLLLGHVFLSALTAVVEHLRLELRDLLFRAVTGTLSNSPQRQSIDELRNWVLDYYREHLRKDCSLHQYVKTLPADVIERVDRLRYSDAIMRELVQAFPQSKIIPLPMTDEVYLSRYNFDGGGDQGLFDKHYDGNLRYLPGASVVRSLIYVSSADRLQVIFDTSGTRANMKTCDFALLDFHKELHWVEGAYDPQSPPRVLLKCNYYVDHVGLAAYRWFGISANLLVFYVVRAAMEYSKSPKTFLQKWIGAACNFFRRVNNFNPAAPVAVTLLVLAVTISLAWNQLSASN